MAANSWICIPEKGIRKVQLDELMKMKDLCNSQYTNVTYEILRDSIEQHVWACLGEAITPYIISPADSPSTQPVCQVITSLPKQPLVLPSPWQWIVPDLQEEGSFYKARVKRLISVIKEHGLEEEF